jgi:uncharacterized protein YndB with AHSA1/START domain
LRYDRVVISPQVERDIFIEAPIDVVWRMVTEPEQMTRWFADEVDLDPAVGAEGELRFKTHRTFTLRVEAVEPMHRFAFRWAAVPGDKPPGGNSLLVEFTLSEEAGGTRLRVVESGFEHLDWSDAEIAKYADDHNHGWNMYLGRLRDLVVQPR